MDLKSVEIMSIGRWNGKEITEQTFDDVIEAFEKTKTYAKPVLKLGHNDEQKLLAKDGLPAAGWVANVYKQGKKLCADFVDIPTKIYELIQKKAYRKVSVELYSGLTLEGKTFPTFLGAVALLGADLPAMTSLDDILSMYTLDTTADIKYADFLPFSSDNHIIKETVEYFDKRDQMDENQNQTDLQKLVDDQQKLIEQLTGQVDQFKKAGSDISGEFEQFKKDSEAKIADLLKSANQNQVDLFAIDLEKQGLLSPSLKAHILPFLESSVATPAKFSVGEKELAGHEWLASLLTLAKEVYAINKQETTQQVTPKAEGSAADLDKEIEALASAEKITYSQAYKKIIGKKG